MNQLPRRFNIVTLALFLVWQSCATMQQPKTSSDYSKEIQELSSALRTNPNDTNARRDLGAIYYETGQYKLALNCLIKSLKQNPKDPKTLAYLGMTLEAVNKDALALKVYKKYSRIPLLSSYRRIMQGRYHLLNRKMAHEQMRALLAREEQLGERQLSANAIAVFPFEYQGNDQNLAALGKGVSEMIITDLSQVPGLTLIERVRLQALLDEMAIGQSGIVDETSAPRFGKLLSAGKIIHGNYQVQGKDKLQLEVAYWDVVNDPTPNFSNKNDQLQNIFRLEKDLVFGLIDEMGIELSPQQREKILFVPTQNMQAFMAYCMGLNNEDAGKFEDAVQFYQQAIQLDPNFKIANQKLELNEASSLAENSKDKISTLADKQDKQVLPASAANDLVGDRLQSLSTNIGSNFILGQDSRKSIEEAAEAGANIGLGDLPEPPRPPARR